MRIVIAGDGKVGSALTEMLSNEGHDIVVIDNNKRVLRNAVEALDVMVLHGNGAALEVQREAEVDKSDLFIAVTSADETNLLCCVLARKLGCKTTIARVRNPLYAEQIAFLKDDLGLNMVVNPELSAAGELFRLLQFPSFLQRDSFAKGRVEIVQITLEEDSKLAGKKLSELYRNARVQVLVCLVERGNKVFIPDGNFKLCKNDRIFVTASSRDLAKLIHNLKLDRNKVHNVIIVGGGGIAYYLAADLIAAGVDVKIIEKNEARCEELAELLPGAVIIHGDGSERTVLDSESISRTDAVVTLTDKDEENFIVSMYAEFVGVPKVVTKINHTEYLEVFKDKGIANVVSPKELISRQITRYVRAMRNTEGAAAIAMHKVGRLEALEFRVDGDTLHIGEQLKNVRLKPGVLIACISHINSIVIPSGNDAIETGDTVIVVTTDDRNISELNDIFEDYESGDSTE